MSLADQALAVKVDSNVSLSIAVTLAEAIKEYRAQVDVLTEPVILTARAALAAARDQKATLLAPIEPADVHLRVQMSEYKTAQDRIRAEALAAAEAERQRLADAETCRVKAEQERVDAAARDAREREIAAAKKSGDRKLAQRLLSEPIDAPIVARRPVFAPPVFVESAAADGVLFQERWEAEVTSLEELVKAVATGRASVGLLQANMTALNQVARALKSKLDIPGVMARKRDTAAIRTSRRRDGVESE
jgi:hypothetical protein